jgi:hypothetical protein
VGDDFQYGGGASSGAGGHRDGEVVFLTGNPAMMRESHTYKDERIASLGGMTLATFRELAAKSK